MPEQRPRRSSIAILRDWWERQRGNRPMPYRTEIDPAALRHALADLLIVDVSEGDRPGTHHFTYRLAGTEVEDRYGFYLTGKTVEQAYLGDTALSVRAEYEEVVASARPVHCHHRAVAGGKRYVEYERLAVPLADPGGAAVAALLIAIEFICAYDLATGRPPDCAGVHCVRPDRCTGAGKSLGT